MAEHQTAGWGRLRQAALEEGALPPHTKAKIEQQELQGDWVPAPDWNPALSL